MLTYSMRKALELPVCGLGFRPYYEFSLLYLFIQSRWLHEPGAQILPPLVFLFILYNNKNTGVFLVGRSPRFSS